MHKEILLAAKNIESHLPSTPLVYSSVLSEEYQCRVYLKCENFQPTNAFKVRGALNKILNLNNNRISKDIVTASSGNHGAAVAYWLNKLNLQGKIFLPENAVKTKVENIRQYNLPITFVGKDCSATELHAIKYAAANNATYISPYNDLHVIAGQGTIGVELQNQCRNINAVFVPVGGGGLIAGIGSYIKHTSPQTKIIGCLPANSPVMAASIAAGQIIEMHTLPSLSDATAGGIEPGAITFPLCQQVVDQFLLTDEIEIESALKTLVTAQRLIVEGASAVALAAFKQVANQFRDQTIVIILSGANINTEQLIKLLN